MQLSSLKKLIPLIVGTVHIIFMYHYLLHSSMFVRRNLTPMQAFNSIPNFLANNDWLRNVNIIYFKPIKPEEIFDGTFQGMLSFSFSLDSGVQHLGGTMI